MDFAEEAQPKILLADDSRMIRATARKMLGDQFDLILADSGEEAWAGINSDPTIMAVFTDVSMPGLDGYGLLQRIREDERDGINALPVIFITGDSDAGARESALNAGATDFITKPFDRSELAARASAYATRDQMRRQAKVLEESRTQDTVTGLGNGRYLGARLKSTGAYSARHGASFALIQLELFDFNDLIHEQDRASLDDLLREVGQVLAHRVREEDVLARVGKARFAALCPNCDLEGAHKLGQRLVEAVRGTHYLADRIELGAAAGVHAPALDVGGDVQGAYKASQQAIDNALARGDGALVVTATEVEAEAQAPAAGAREAITSLDEALEIAATEGGPDRLGADMPELLERCAQLFRAAPRDVAKPVLDRLQAELGDG
jgi:diguanylate cyclase (GGDEF)-like protein